MKKSIISVLAILLMTTTAFAGKDKSTLKEKVEKSKTVKVFFNVRDIIDKSHEGKLQQANPKAKTDIRTVMPEAFYSSEVKNNVVKKLNEGLQVGSAFVVADISELAMSSKKNTNYRDLSKLDDGIYAMVDISGLYTRFLERKEVNGTSVFEASNNMEIQANLFFYEIIDGKVKKIKVNMGMGAFLGRAKTSTIKTDKLETIEYMESNFPASELLAEYTRTMDENLLSVTKRLLKKHDKAISKRK